MVWNPYLDQNYVPSKRMNFEQAAVRMLHKTWFPGISPKRVENALGEPFTWENYEKYLSFSGARPDITFVKDDRFWNYNIHNILKVPLEKSIFWKLWEEQPSDCLVFPLVSMYGCLHYGHPERDGIVKFTKKGQPVFIELMTVWAKDYAPEGNFNFLEES